MDLHFEACINSLDVQMRLLPLQGRQLEDNREPPAKVREVQAQAEAMRTAQSERDRARNKGAKGQ
eukprot:8962800-Karenia_brevis.AAC.1